MKIDYSLIWSVDRVLRDKTDRQINFRYTGRFSKKLRLKMSPLFLYTKFNSSAYYIFNDILALEPGVVWDVSKVKKMAAL